MNEKQNEQLYMLIGHLAKMQSQQDTPTSSVEQADRIFASIEYCMDAYLRSQGRSIAQIQPEDEILDLYNQGYIMQEKKLQEAKEIWRKVKNSTLPIDNTTYRNTIWERIATFFASYDLRFAAKLTPGEIAYPLAIPVEQASGINYIDHYLKTLLLENRILSKFDLEEVQDLLYSYQQEHSEFVLNVLEAVITNAAGRYLLRVDRSSQVAEERDAQCLTSLAITSEEKSKLLSLLRTIKIDELQRRLERFVQEDLKQAGITSQEMLDYLSFVVKRISYGWIKDAREQELVHSFISLGAANDGKVISMHGEKLSKEEYQRIRDQLEDARSLKDKLSIMEKHISNTYDLLEMCEYCIAGDEYYSVLMLLSEAEREQLRKQIQEEVDAGADQTVFPEWKLTLQSNDPSCH